MPRRGPWRPRGVPIPYRLRIRSPRRRRRESGIPFRISSRPRTRTRRSPPASSMCAKSGRPGSASSCAVPGRLAHAAPQPPVPHPRHRPGLESPGNALAELNSDPDGIERMEIPQRNRALRDEHRGAARARRHPCRNPSVSQPQLGRRGNGNDEKDRRRVDAADDSGGRRGGVSWVRWCTADAESASWRSGGRARLR